MDKYFNWSKSYRFSYLPSGILLLLAWCFIIVGVTTGLLIAGLSVYIVLPIGLFFLTILGLRIFRTGRLSGDFVAARQKFLASISAGNSSQVLELTPLMSELSHNNLENVTLASGDNWQFGDFRYTVDYSIGDIDVKGEYRYFSVIEIDLGRELPAFVFNSKRLSSHPLGSLLDTSQKTSLEGNFDDYFDTYFPIHYHVDSRSVISPEVMLALIELNNCDIEFFGTKMHVYCITPDNSMIMPIINKALFVREKLVDHIVAYRDELVGDVKDRHNVSSVGDNLRRNASKSLITSIVAAFVAIYGTWSLWDDINTPPIMGEDSNASFLRSIIIIVLGWMFAYLFFKNYRSIKQENTYKDEEFKRLSGGKQ